MKPIYKTIVSFLFLVSSSYPQFYAEDEVSSYIIEFMKIADETAIDYNEYVQSFIKPQKTFTDEELKHIAEFYYKCYNENPVGFVNYVNEEHNKWEKRIIESDRKSDELRPWWKVFYLKNQVAYKYGISFTEVITTPAFLRGKFTATDIPLM